MITVEYAPGGSDPIHRHDAHAFVYVLEGSIVMQVKGGKEVTLTPGQTFYESPKHVHVVSRNTSSTKPAKFLVLFLKDKSAPLLLPANQLRNSAAADITDLRTATRMQEHLCRYERTT